MCFVLIRCGGWGWGLGCDLLDAVDASLVRLGDEQGAQVGQGDGLGRLQGGPHGRPAHQVVVDARHLAVDGTSRHDADVEAL